MLPPAVHWISWASINLPETIAMDNQVKNSPLHVAPKSSSQFTWYNLRVCFLISLAPLAFGYCVSIVSSTLGQPSFLLYMGLVDPETFEPTKNASSIEGAMSAMFFVRQCLQYENPSR